MPKLHPAFDDFAKRVRTYSIGEPGYSDAIEFTDGKLVLGQQQFLSDLSWQSILSALSLAELSELVKQAGLIARTRPSFMQLCGSARAWSRRVGILRGQDEWRGSFWESPHSAAALRCLGGGMRAKIWPRDESEKTVFGCRRSGRSPGQGIHVDLARGQSLIFTATGISSGPLLDGVLKHGKEVVFSADKAPS